MEGSPYGKCGGGWVGCGEGLRLGAISSQTGTRGGECAGGGLSRDRSCARRERGGRSGFRAVREGVSGCGRSNARSGPVPLPLRGSVVGLALGVSRGWEFRRIVPALAGKLGGGGAFALCAMGRLDRFLCLLRPGPAAASWFGPGQEGSGKVRRSECPNGAPHTSPG
jgi:hypothetical protein